MFATVDDELYNELMNYSWSHCGHPPNRYYVVGRRNGESIQMSKKVLDIDMLPDNLVIDHINGNKLDNRKCNLRICTRLENAQNRLPNKNSISKYKGVNLRKDVKNKKWRATIQCNKKRYSLGDFLTEKEAAKAYNIKAKELFGQFAVLNKV